MSHSTGDQEFRQARNSNIKGKILLLIKALLPVSCLKTYEC
jgi:hypothetical protein